jgi:FlaA1/EpsC-like NDP-sugar epimerase
MNKPGFLQSNRLPPSVIVWASQVAIFALSGLGSFLLRFDFAVPLAYRFQVSTAVAIWIVVKIAVFHLGGLDRGWWRYVSIGDLPRIALGNLAGSLLGAVAISWIAPPGFPRSIYVLDLILSFLGSAGIRVVFRAAAELSSSPRSSPGRKNTLIYGAGDGGVILLRELENNPRLSYRVRGFLDDCLEKRGRLIFGVPVLGGGDDAKLLVNKHEIETILIAIPSATGAQMTRILDCCRTAASECKTVPGLGEIIQGVGLAGQMREIDVEDLLGRKPVRLEEERIRAAFAGKVVMVTGAAGSIGSELCRQIAAFQPAGIVGFEVAESPLFEIDREMRQKFPHAPFYPEIGSVQNPARLDEVMRQHRPSAVYHAAAYKHVPLMETHIFEAVENNIFGTWNLAAAAARHGVDDFVLISSDKAVRPSSMMGATKRVAEIMLRALQNGGTKYVAVRFGNVLGSNGSVIPIFKSQIAAGGPVTVTHPDMHRFFMTIPEACQLVLQAATIAEGGQICVLDMGEQVRIVDLARSLIRLSGLRPDEDIRLEYTGIRPGEKLREELSSIFENTMPTTHEKIHIYVGSDVPEPDILDKIEALREICQSRDAGRLVVALKEIVQDYSPSAHLLERLIVTRDQHMVL